MLSASLVLASVLSLLSLLSSAFVLVVFLVDSEAGCEAGSFGSDNECGVRNMPCSLVRTMIMLMLVSMSLMMMMMTSSLLMAKLFPAVVAVAVDCAAASLIVGGALLHVVVMSLRTKVCRVCVV